MLYVNAYLLRQLWKRPSEGDTSKSVDYRKSILIPPRQLLRLTGSHGVLDILSRKMPSLGGSHTSIFYGAGVQGY